MQTTRAGLTWLAKLVDYLETEHEGDSEFDACAFSRQLPNLPFSRLMCSP